MMCTPTRSVLVGLALGIALLAGSPAAERQAERPQRIVSLVPAVTEMLFAIGAGSRVVAVSSFDDYPPEVRRLERVGALLDPDLERMLRLRPDLVIAYATQSDLLRQLARAGIPVYRYRHEGLPDVTATIRELGARIGREDAAEAVVRGIESQLADIRRRVAGRSRPRTLIVLAREALALRGIYASGGIGFVHDMVETAGGENVFSDVQRESLQATSEVILARRPDVILDLRADRLPAGQAEKEVGVWASLSAIPAVRSGRIVLIQDPRVVVPGPRVGEGTAVIARALHPDAFR